MEATERKQSNGSSLGDLVARHRGKGLLVARALPVLCLVAALFGAPPAGAGIVAQVDNGAQRMRVIVDGQLAYTWPVSTARKGYQTPAGRYRVQRMERMWYSRKYDMSPMPNALFFHGGYAIHGTYSVAQLGRPASHGCVRLSPANAGLLFNLVREHGGARVEVVNGARTPSVAARMDPTRQRTGRVVRDRAPVWYSEELDGPIYSQPQPLFEFLDE